MRKIRTNGLKAMFRLPATKSRETLSIILFQAIFFPNILKNIAKLRRTLNDLKKHNRPLYQNSKKALSSYSRRAINTKQVDEYLSRYSEQNVKLIQKNNQTHIDADTPILICAVKNDLHRVKMQVNHHKNLGINKMVYIDNMSDDGTLEWLVEEGIDVYQVDDKFSSTAKNSWFRQITDIYGYNRWYLILDSDELFVYPGMEDHKINKLIDFANEANIDIFQTFMIDMYSKDELIGGKSDTISLDAYDIKKENNYFDTQTYFIEQGYEGDRILGGPRYRMFSDDTETFTPLLTKNPLIYLKKETFFSVHHSIPYYKNFNHPIISGILHYKFLPTDNKKYKKIVEEGNYAGGSIEYKRYLEVIENNEKLSFYYEKSKELTHSLDLLEINIFDKKQSNRLLDSFNKNDEKI